MIHIDRLLEQCVRRGATEIRLRPGERPQLYVGDSFVPAGLRPLTDEDMRSFMRSITPDAKQRELENGGQVSFDFSFGDVARFYVRVQAGDSVTNIVLRPALAPGEKRFFTD